MKDAAEARVFTKDKPALFMSVIVVFLAIVNNLIVLARLRSNDFKVPIQYVVNDGSVLQTSSWYSLYSLGLFSAVGAIAVLFLAHRLHKGSRGFALGILVVFICIQVITVLVTNALLGLVGRV